MAKAWIPKEDDCGNKLWFGKNSDIDNYVRGLGEPSPDNTVFVSPIDGQEGVTQILLRPNMLKGKSHDMELGAKCVEGDPSKLPTDIVADWQSWNIKGRS